MRALRPGPRRHGGPKSSSVVVCAVALIALLAGCAPGASARPAGTMAASSLIIGGCFSIPAGRTDALFVLAKECDVPHDGQVYGSIRYEGEAKPETDDFDTTVRALCARQLLFVDQENLGNGAFDYGYIPPTPAEWHAGYRIVRCTLFAADGSKLEYDYT